jgi:DNA invertase Pin-like site-specific DNA recombinase
MESLAGKTKSEHLNRKAFLYIRQSTLRQVTENGESTKRQYALRERLVAIGWDESRVEVIDSDLGQSGSSSEERHGFQYLVSEVSLGRAGIIAGIEVSRLSRSSSDWTRLLQIAALSDTLIMDEDGVYNVNDFNDRLLLGLKGTLSEAELHYLRARMRGGLLNKAKRGELQCPLSIGYVYDENGRIAKDPDAQVQEAIGLLFSTFKRVGSGCGCVREFEKQGLLFPHSNSLGFRQSEITWKKLTRAKALCTLKNPLYAGVYAFGKVQVRHTVEGRKHKAVPKESYHAWLPDSHPGYISEFQFEENLRQLAANTHPRPDLEHGGAAREGSALLQGIALCGVCGRKMTVHYYKSTRGMHPVYSCQHGGADNSGQKGLVITGTNIDIAIGELLLETINPLTMEAAMAVQREMTGRKEEIVRLYSQQMERARYDMELAKRRYLRVDPDNRLVAAELERDWNQKAGAYGSAKMAYEQKCDAEVRTVDDELKAALEQLVTDFPAVWNDPRTSNKEKKRIARSLLEDVTLSADASTVVLGIRFKGGATKVIEIPKIKRDLNLVNMEQAAAEEIKAMILDGRTNLEIVDALGEKGYTIGYRAKPFNVNSVNYMVQRHDLPRRREVAKTDGWLNATEKMAELHIGRTKLDSMREAGELEFKVSHIKSKTYLYKSAASVV